MQNFEIVVVDNKKLLKKIGGLGGPVSLAFVRENYRQLSFTEAELRRKKVGLLAQMFPPAWRNPKATATQIQGAERRSFQERQIASSSALLVVLFDPKRRAPISEHDFLGAVSLGGMLENMWLTAQALGLGFHVVSALAGGDAAARIKRMLHIPGRLRIAFAIRLGYPVVPVKYLRVRRNVKDFVHYNIY